MGKTGDSTHRGHRRVAAGKGKVKGWLVGTTEGCENHRDEILQRRPCHGCDEEGNLGKVLERTRLGPKIQSQLLRVIKDGGQEEEVCVKRTS